MIRLYRQSAMRPSHIRRGDRGAYAVNSSTHDWYNRDGAGTPEVGLNGSKSVRVVLQFLEAPPGEGFSF